MNNNYSILVLRGAQMRQFVVSKYRLRELLLMGLLALSICGLLLSELLLAQQKKLDTVIASGLMQKDKLLVLHEQAKAVQASLARWKELRQRIHAALPQRDAAAGGAVKDFKDGEALQLRLATIDNELKRLIAALPSEWPVQGRVSSGVGPRRSPWTGAMEYHAGLDIPKPIGTPVYASGDAVVESTDKQRGTVVLNHGQEIKTLYSHLSKILVSSQAPVRKGQLIAEVGNRGKSTGPHLHYEVRVAGVAIDPRRSMQSSRLTQLDSMVGGGMGSSN